MSLGKSFSYLVAAYNFSAELLRVYGSVSAAKEEGALERLNVKYFTAKNSLFNLKYQEVGDTVSDIDIIHYSNKIKLLPTQFQKIIADNDYIKNCKEIKKLCGFR